MSRASSSNLPQPPAIAVRGLGIEWFAIVDTPYLTADLLDAQ